MKAFFSKYKNADIFLILFLQVMLYCSVSHFDFVWDDQYLVGNDQLLNHGIPILELFQSHFWKFSSLDYSVPYYRPLTMLIFMVEKRVFGNFAGSYHLVNLSIHLMNIVLVWIIAAQLGLKRIPQLICTLFFSLHPSQVQTVSFISSQGDLLCLLFSLVSMSLWIGKHRWIVASLIAAFIAMLCKEAGVIVPVILFLFDTLVRKKSFKNITTYRPFLIWIPYFALRVYGLSSATGYHSTTPWLWNSLGGYRTLLLLGRILFPIPMPPEITIMKFSDAVLVAFNAAYLSLLALCVVWFRKEKLPFFLIVCFFISMFLVGDWRGYNIRLSDQFLYIPLFTFSCIVGLYSWKSKNHTLPLIVLFAIFSVISAGEIYHWKNNVRLWSSAVRHEPNNAGFNLNLAMALQANGYQKESCEILEYSMKLIQDKNDFDLTRIILTNYGNCKLHIDPFQAEQIYKSVLLFDPSYYPARLNLIESLLGQNKTTEALEHAVLLTQHSSTKPDAWKVLGFVYKVKGEKVQSDEAYKKAAELTNGI